MLFQFLIKHVVILPSDWWMILTNRLIPRAPINSRAKITRVETCLMKRIKDGPGGGRGGYVVQFIFALAKFLFNNENMWLILCCELFKSRPCCPIDVIKLDSNYWVEFLDQVGFVDVQLAIRSISKFSLTKFHKILPIIGVLQWNWLDPTLPASKLSN